ncbi:MAG: hypothetical protein PHH60_04215 [Candidatus Margulisbacteria bacterium]|nr:hypothetical protein [Candidatus Margulisiibacteriota bacterium]
MFSLRLSSQAAEIPMFIVFIIVLGLLSWLTEQTGLQVGLIWVVVYALLDFGILIQLLKANNPAAYYGSSRLYFWYALIVIEPVLARIASRR